MADAQATLDSDNREAWGIYGRLCNRFTVDLHVAPVVMASCVEGWSADAVIDLVDRLALMHDVLNPPPPRTD